MGNYNSTPATTHEINFATKFEKDRTVKEISSNSCRSIALDEFNVILTLFYIDNNFTVVKSSVQRKF